jgi:hypothetical protein
MSSSLREFKKSVDGGGKFVRIGRHSIPNLINRCAAVCLVITLSGGVESAQNITLLDGSEPVNLFVCQCCENNACIKPTLAQDWPAFVGDCVEFSPALEPKCASLVEPSRYDRCKNGNKYGNDDISNHDSSVLQVLLSIAIGVLIGTPVGIWLANFSWRIWERRKNKEVA